MSTGAEQLEKGRRALRRVGASEILVDNAPESVVSLIGQGESEVERIDRARCMLQVRRETQRKLAVRERWKLIHGRDPFGDGELEDPFSDR